MFFFKRLVMVIISLQSNIKPKTITFPKLATKIFCLKHPLPPPEIDYHCPDIKSEVKLAKIPLDCPNYPDNPI